ncbi:hypothetical protein [Streptomyces sp. NPDC051909]|uniref:hypothetical protein n=1 Tax=Streptomyces sp. NPDC051909 TaxID=3154944 RepID=UPI0034417894
MTGSGVSDGRSKALWWAGIGIGVLGVAALVAVAVADLGKADQIASVAGAVLAAAGLGLSLWSLRGGGAGAAGVTAAGDRSVAAGGNIGAVATGDGATAGPAPTGGGTPAPATPVARPATGPVTASGDRSVAAGGDIGSVSTGDA